MKLDGEDDLNKGDLEEAARKLASQAKQRERKEIAAALTDWVWVSEACAFVRRSDRKIWNEKQWGSHYAHLQPKGRLVETVMKKRGYITKFEKMVFEPGAPEDMDGVAYNLWRPSGCEPKPGDVTWFLDHIRYLHPEPEIADMALDYLALLVREPFQKVHFALLVYGKRHGVGKSALGLLQRKMLGDHNVVLPNNDEFGERFTEWQEGAQLAIIEELMMLGRQQISNRLKPVITQPELRIRAMYRSAYSTPNRLNIMAFTNHPDALRIENEDRRWLVLETAAEPRPPSYYDELFGRIANPDDVAAVKHYLQNRDVRLNPTARAPATDAKRTMVEQALPDDEAYVKELFESKEEPFDCDLLRTDDIITAVQLRFKGTVKPNIISRTTSLLQSLGAVQYGRYTHPDRPNWRLWVVRNHEHWEAAGPTGRLDEYMLRSAQRLCPDWERMSKKERDQVVIMYTQSRHSEFLYLNSDGATG